MLGVDQDFVCQDIQQLSLPFQVSFIPCVTGILGMRRKRAGRIRIVGAASFSPYVAEVPEGHLGRART